jgi:membrane protease YdiL (CAAX protease family)
MKRGPDAPGVASLAGFASFLAVAFSVLMSSRRLGPLDFWWGMALTMAIAAGLAFRADRGYGRRLREDLARGPARRIALGLVSAALLYGVFAAGRVLALKVFSFAGPGIDSVYALRSGAGTIRIVLLLGLLVGPGEELLWRGFLQENLQKRLGRLPGFAVTTAVYAAVHVASGNIMLILAASVCGVFWGWLYLTFRSPLLNAVSHTAWDLLVFVLFPL